MNRKKGGKKLDVKQYKLLNSVTIEYNILIFDLKSRKSLSINTFLI